MTTLELALPLATFVVFATPLSLIDAQRHILPNRIVFAGCSAIVGLEAIMATHQHAPHLLWQSLITATETLLVYVILLVVSRGQLGMGDVKYSFMTGLIVGWIAPDMWLTTIWLAFALAALWILFTRLREQREMAKAIAFGPFMSISTVLCTLIGLGNL